MRGYRIDEIETPDYTDALGLESKLNVKAKRLHTALTLMLAGIPVKLDDGTVVALAWSENGKLIPLKGQVSPGESEREAVLYPVPDWKFSDFTEFVAERISEKRHSILCSVLASLNKKRQRRTENPKKIEIDGLGRFVISREDGTIHDFAGQGRESAFAKTPAGFLLALIFDAENEDRIPELAEKLEEQGITPEVLHAAFTDEAMTKAEKEEFLYLFSGGDDRWRFGGGFNNVDEEVYETVLEKLEEAGLTEEEARERLEEVFEEAVRVSSFGFENVRDEVEKEVKSELERLKEKKSVEDYLYGLLEAVERVNETLNEAYRNRLYEALAEELPELREDSSPEP